MIPHGLTKDEYEAIPDNYVHLYNGLDIIHKMPTLGTKRLNEYLAGDWEIVAKDGSKLSAEKVKEVKAFVKKIASDTKKKEDARLERLESERSKEKINSKTLEAANAARDAAIQKVEDQKAAVEEKDAEIEELKAKLVDAGKPEDEKPEGEKKPEGEGEQY